MLRHSLVFRQLQGVVKAGEPCFEELWRSVRSARDAIHAHAAAEQDGLRRAGKRADPGEMDAVLGERTESGAEGTQHHHKTRPATISRLQDERREIELEGRWKVECCQMLEPQLVVAQAAGADLLEDARRER